eukprot:CAMPEP_0181441384 /NCGR_PEP_ID=MMETSP1110-20121109/23481_1 /TAXON_ID=174948 /ORGANISM="Symbiodinium sp., Strain CCMP421" /LENGTH=289 /DNA_ID=CAMNT_0023565269 /DNA_START=59 /DNA_END=928 /DNA_ORIENTATION=+
MRLRPRLAAVLLLGVLIDANQPEEEEEVRVFADAVTGTDTEYFQSLINRGNTLSCCGYWADQAAVRMQQFVAQQLHVTRRSIGDVHFDNITAVRASRDEHGHWSGVAVMYLEDLGASQVQLQRRDHEVELLEVARGSLVQVPEGAVLLHTLPLRVAWARIRAEAPRGLFEFYLASWVQRQFVMPYDTANQRRFFRKHTRHPRYWHGFLWSFVGTFCTVFACLPVAWFGVQALAKLHGRDDAEEKGLSPTLLPRVGRKVAGKSGHGTSFGKAFGLPQDYIKTPSKSHMCT